jgi:hypothetical protein
MQAFHVTIDYTPCHHPLHTMSSSIELRDMGTYGYPPTRVPEVPVKWTRPVRSPANLQGPKTLSTTPVPEASICDESAPPLESIPIGRTSSFPYHSRGLVPLDHSARIEGSVHRSLDSIPFEILLR